MTMAGQPGLAHLFRLLDDTGIAQHATYAVVARDHGYCLDDNARGLLLAATLRRLGIHAVEADMLFTRTAAFVQHAWNLERGRFRNFMSYDRRWLDEVGSEDSHGRAVWALGITARDAPDDDVRRWAQEVLDRAVPALPAFTSPRAIAFGLLGLAAWQGSGGAPDTAAMRARLAGRLSDHLRDSQTPDWVWFEGSLSYDNARLPEAMLAAGQVDDRPEWRAIGLETLQWLCRVQTSKAGAFSPIGSDGFWTRGGLRARFDQQPIEAAGGVSCALLAYRVTRDTAWLREAERAHAWFRGANDTGQALVLTPTGACRDGLQPARVNANQGAESTLAWLQADFELAEAQPGTQLPLVARAAE